LTPWLKYGFVGFLFVGLVGAAIWPMLGPDARRGVLIGAAVAYPIQLLAFGLMVRYRDRANAFLAVWAGGTLVRMGSVLAVGVLLLKVEVADPAALLLALAGFFFGLLLLEPLFLRPGTFDLNRTDG
jgi:hypothetical protein